jgi:hypothetical protein
LIFLLFYENFDVFVFVAYFHTADGVDAVISCFDDDSFDVLCVNLI